MEIRNNYSTGMTVLKAKNTNNQHNNKTINQTTNYSDVNFQGANFSMVFIDPLKRLKFNREMKKPLKFSRDLEEMIQNYGGSVGNNYKSLIGDLKNIARKNGLTNKSGDFLSAMLKRANDYGLEHFKEDYNGREPLLALFARVKSPKPTHCDFIEESRLSMHGVKRCFDVCNDNTEMLWNLNSISKRINEIYNTEEKQTKVLSDLINSKHAAEHIKEYEQTIGYIKRHGRDNGSENTIIQNLEESYNNGSLVLDTKRKDLSNILGFQKSEKPTERFLEHYSTEGNKVLKLLNDKFKPLEDSNPEETANSYLHIYKTTTKDNVEIRTRFIEHNYVSYVHRTKKLPKDEVKNLAELFDIVDKDENAYNFLVKSIDFKQTDRSAMLHNAGAYIELFKKYDTAELARKSDKILEPVKNSESEAEIEKKLQKIDDVMSETTTFDFLVNCYVNCYDVLLALFGRKSAKTKALKKITGQSANQQVKTVTERRIEQPANQQVETVTERRIEQPANQQVETVVKKPKFSLAEANKANLANMITATPRKASVDRKLKIAQSSVSPLLKKHIKSERVLNEQEFLYTKNATKLRASMLPDIFESIKVTRAEAKAANKGKLSKNFVKNEDAIDLYNLINSKNKKLVKSMLNETTEEGKRKYNVKDVIEILEAANKETSSIRKDIKNIEDRKSKETELYNNLLFNKNDERKELVKKYQPKINKDNVTVK